MPKIKRNDERAHESLHVELKDATADVFPVGTPQNPDGSVPEDVEISVEEARKVGAVTSESARINKAQARTTHRKLTGDKNITFNSKDAYAVFDYVRATFGTANIWVNVSAVDASPPWTLPIVAMSSMRSAADLSAFVEKYHKFRDAASYLVLFKDTVERGRGLIHMRDRRDEVPATEQSMAPQQPPPPPYGYGYPPAGYPPAPPQGFGTYPYQYPPPPPPGYYPQQPQHVEPQSQPAPQPQQPPSVYMMPPPPAPPPPPPQGPDAVMQAMQMQQNTIAQLMAELAAARHVATPGAPSTHVPPPPAAPPPSEWRWNAQIRQYEWLPIQPPPAPPPPPPPVVQAAPPPPPPAPAPAPPSPLAVIEAAAGQLTGLVKTFQGMQGVMGSFQSGQPIGVPMADDELDPLPAAPVDTSPIITTMVGEGARAFPLQIYRDSGKVNGLATGLGMMPLIGGLLKDALEGIAKVQNNQRQSLLDVEMERRRTITMQRQPVQQLAQEVPAPAPVYQAPQPTYQPPPPAAPPPPPPAVAPVTIDVPWR